MEQLKMTFLEAKGSFIGESTVMKLIMQIVTTL